LLFEKKNVMPRLRKTNVNDLILWEQLQVELFCGDQIALSIGKASSLVKATLCCLPFNGY